MRETIATEQGNLFHMPRVSDEKMLTGTKIRETMQLGFHKKLCFILVL